MVAGIRPNTGIAYLTNEIRRCPNLTIRGRVEVDRLLISRGATGVVCVDELRAPAAQRQPELLVILAPELRFVLAAPHHRRLGVTRLGWKGS